MTHHRSFSSIVVGAAFGAVLAAVGLTLAVQSSRTASEPAHWTFYAFALGPTLTVLGIDWGAWIGWLLTNGPHPFVLKIVMPTLLSIPVVAYFLYITGLRW